MSNKSNASTEMQIENEAEDMVEKYCKEFR